MIKIELHRTSNGAIAGFFVKGHAGRPTGQSRRPMGQSRRPTGQSRRPTSQSRIAKNGQDIVCAAVSVLTQTAVLGISQHLELPLEYIRKDGYLACTLSQVMSEAATVQAILETMAIGLKEIAEQFPDFVRIEEHRR